MNKAAITADAPAIGKLALGECLAHGMPAKNQGFEDQALAVLIHIDLNLACQTAMVKQDRFLRQPVKPGTILCGEFHIKSRRIITGTAIGAFRGLSGNGDITGIGTEFICEASPPVMPPAVLTRTTSFGGP